MMGGADRIMARARQLHDEGKYMLAQEILNKLVYAEPKNQAAKDLLADVFEQIGYQQENPGLRNSYLAGAYELRQGIPSGETASSSSPDVIRAMSTELFLNFLGIRMDSAKAEGMSFTVNLLTPDNGEKFVIEMANATLTNTAGFLAAKPDLTITINRVDLEKIMGGASTIEEQVAKGAMKLNGDASLLGKLASTMVDFDPRFQILPGTKVREAAVKKTGPFEVGLGDTIAE
jgi:alkyl sulfatase BDS1-like metallo-beta-lactamase superfamily hydrolase